MFKGFRANAAIPRPRVNRKPAAGTLIRQEMTRQNFRRSAQKNTDCEAAGWDSIQDEEEASGDALSLAADERDWMAAVDLILRRPLSGVRDHRTTRELRVNTPCHRDNQNRTQQEGRKRPRAISVGIHRSNRVGRTRERRNGFEDVMKVQDRVDVSRINVRIILVPTGRATQPISESPRTCPMSKALLDFRRFGANSHSSSGHQVRQH